MIGIDTAITTPTRSTATVGTALSPIDQANLLPLRHEVVHGFVRRLTRGSHQDDHVPRLGVPDVVEQPIRAPRAVRERPHGLLHDFGEFLVERVARLPGLEERIRVLCRPPDHGRLGIQGAAPVRPAEILKRIFFILPIQPRVIASSYHSMLQLENRIS